MKNTLLTTLTHAINAYLKLDPESTVRLQALQGKTVTITLLPLALTCQCHFHAEGVTICTGESLEAETKITGTPLQLLGVMLAKDNRQRFFAEDVVIEGNAALGQQVMELFDALEMDWEEYLSQKIGDVPAHHVGQFARRVHQWLQDTRINFTADVNDYLHEEKRWFPTRLVLNDFFNDIDTLRMDVDRLEATFNQLTREIKNEGSP